MAKFVVLYHEPADGAAFDAHYRERHVPLAKKIPGLIRYEVSDGPVGAPGGPSPYRLVATLEFATLGALRAGLASAEGAAAAKDVRLFADGGVEMLIFDTKDV